MGSRRRRIGDAERQSLADRLRAVMAAYKLSERAVARAIPGVDQAVISRFLSREYVFEAPKTAAVIAYVKMQESGHTPHQLELPFDTRAAMSRFLEAKGDLTLLNGLIDVLTASAAR